MCSCRIEAFVSVSTIAAQLRSGAINQQILIALSIGADDKVITAVFGITCE